MKYRKLICLDFDGVLHNYQSGWRGADVICDGPVPGAQAFVQRLLLAGFDVAIFSSRSNQEGGVGAMMAWCRKYGFPEGVTFPTEKPPAHVHIDDRAIQFTGDFDAISTSALEGFKPWNKRP